MNSLAERIAELRKSHGFSLQQLADRVGCTKTHIWDMETGRASNPTLSTLLGLSRALGCSVGFLAGANGWLPLETAPKDGTEILLYVAAGHGIMGPAPARYAIVQWEDQGPYSYWLLGPGAAWNPNAMTPGTVWQPIPKPPVGAA